MFHRLRLALACVLLCGGGATAHAAGRVELEIATQRGAPLTAAQTWQQVLAEAGADGIRIAEARGGEEPAIEQLGTEDEPVYRVTGILTARDVLILPGGKFTPRDRGRLQEWITRLREQGLSESGGDAPFGLPARQLEAVRADLGQAVRSATRDQSAADVVAALASRLTYDLQLEAEDQALLAEAPPCADEFQGLAAGTALAAVLRNAGLALVPSAAGGQLQYSVASAGSVEDAWPAGWPAEGKPIDVLPTLLEFVNAEIADIPLAEAVAGVAERIGAPVVYDQIALAFHEIDLALPVSQAKTRTTCTQLLRRLLFQGKLKHELRIDDGGRPFLWITTLKPVR